MSEINIQDLLERLANLTQAEMRAATQALGLKPVQGEALVYLSRCNRYSNTPQAVAEYLGLTKGTVSQTLIALERKSLIQRNSDSNDRRVVRLNLTKQGRLILRKLWPSSLLQLALDGPSEQWQELREKLLALLRRVQVQQGSRSFGVCDSCRFHQHQGRRRRCGLTGEPLKLSEASLLCREHEPAQAQASGAASDSGRS